MGLTIGIVAGEVSGDYLGAGLMRAVQRRRPGTRFVGVGGARMGAAGLDTWVPLEQLSVMGLTEVLSRIPALLRLRRQLVRKFRDAGVNAVLGVDAPDFNLGLEYLAHRQGLRTVHYVSPQVWAWRAGRVHAMRRGIDRILCLYPFEPEFYAAHGVDARFVGHPLADEIPLDVPEGPARQALGLPETAPVLAVLPGSRLSEVKRLAGPFLEAARVVKASEPELRVAIPAATESIGSRLEALVSPEDRRWLTIHPSRSREILAAADVVLSASGTATLEATLTGRPMVVGYRVSALSYWLLRRLVRTSYIAQPNLLAGQRLVPELIQGDLTPASLAREILALLHDPQRRDSLRAAFHGIHETLRQGADERAAEALLEVTA